MKPKNFPGRKARRRRRAASGFAHDYAPKDIRYRIGRIARLQSDAAKYPI